ncbi:MAG: SpoIIE family protein phosphatase [Candidatus Acidiferrales bacterium]
MTLLNQEDANAVQGVSVERQPRHLALVRLARDLFNGRYRAGEVVQLSDIEAQYEPDRRSVVNALAEFQTLGMVTFSGRFSAIVHPPNPKEMQEAYEIRAALEEISGRSAAPTLKGDTGELQHALDGMRAAVRKLDLDAYAEHDLRFHRHILQASQNDVLVRVWDTLGCDLRIRAAIEKVTKNLPDVVESHQPIIEALDRGQGREAGVLLRNHVETFVEFLRKSDSAVHRALRQDLESAKDVQEAFFPQDNQAIPGLCCETFYKPAQSIGGDYYDFLPLQDERWGIAIGDVSGKGIGAALLMASLQASLRAQALHAHSDLSALIADVDRLVYASSPDHLYASLFYGEYDSATRVLRYVNAGHNAPMILRWKGKKCGVFRLKALGTPVGLLKGSEFSAKSFQMQVGDVFVAYTDGITEAENSDGEQWGHRRLENLLRDCRNVTPKKITKSILDELGNYCAGRSQKDDITLVVLQVQA